LQVVYRVHWLAARARFHRWEEELNIATHEMEWTTRYFLARATQWAALRDQVIAGGLLDRSSGHVCYAERQRNMWCDFAADAQARYQAINPDFNYIATIV
jgi:hypothetical protein